MKAKEILDILNCLNNIMELEEYDILILETYNKNLIGFTVNTNKKIIEVTTLEED